MIIHRKKFFSGVLNLDNLGSSHEDDYRIDERTKITGSICINNKNINRLLLMDGHGRLTTRIMSYLNNNSSRDFKIQVCDLDNANNFGIQLRCLHTL